MLHFIFKVVSKILMYSAISKKDVKTLGELQGNTICTLNNFISIATETLHHFMFFFELLIFFFFFFNYASDFDDDSDVEVDRSIGERISQEGTVYIVHTV